ncbi:VOC family protein [Bradyrhizobium sp. HKCCYLRH3099]|uniref:VOC family protein n=1 Tax=unclassified Bradyrhizobium TaxID=2631580 RepID=UPI003EB6AF67
MPYLHLRQICLVARRLEPVVSDIAAIMGLEVCYRDPHVGKYGLENALLPVGPILLEVIAPIRDGTAAGRFLDKSGGRGGYMAILSCDDPDGRAARANALGVRTANVIDHETYHGVQLHPRDCRAAFIELNHTDGSDDVLGPYPPAGPDWTRAIRHDVTTALTEVVLQSPEPSALAAHWERILDLTPAANSEGDWTLSLPNAAIRVTTGERECMSGLCFRTDVAVVLDAARARGYAVSGNGFEIAGVTFAVVA